MNAKTEELLLNVIVPMITAAIARGAVRGVGSEDREELRSECIAWAAKILHRAERTGYMPPARKVVYYAMKRTDWGERSTSCSRTGVLAPGTHVEGRCTVLSLDALIAGQDSSAEEEMTFHDMLASPTEDAARAAGRRIDWAEVTQGMDELRMDILRGVVDGRSRKEIARRHKVSVSWVRTVKHTVKGEIRSRWDRTMLEDIAIAPAWRRHVDAYRERRTCRAEAHSR